MINPWSQAAVFVFHPHLLPHTQPLVLWVATLASCQVHMVRSIHLDFLLGYENRLDADADCSEV